MSFSDFEHGFDAIQLEYVSIRFECQNLIFIDAVLFRFVWIFDSVLFNHQVFDFNEQGSELQGFLVNDMNGASLQIRHVLDWVSINFLD